MKPWPWSLQEPAKSSGCFWPFLSPQIGARLSGVEVAAKLGIEEQKTSKLCWNILAGANAVGDGSWNKPTRIIPNDTVLMCIVCFFNPIDCSLKRCKAQCQKWSSCGGRPITQWKLIGMYVPQNHIYFYIKLHVYVHNDTYFIFLCKYKTLCKGYSILSISTFWTTNTLKLKPQSPKGRWWHLRLVVLEFWNGDPRGSL